MNPDIVEGAIKVELIKQAVALCFRYYSIGEFTANEARNELEHYSNQVLKWNLDKELPGWAKDND